MSLSLSAPVQPSAPAAASTYGILGYMVLFAPVALAYTASFDPVLSYLVAWGGSWFLFLGTTSGGLLPIPQDRPWTHQLFRPLFLVHAVFSGFFCLSSVFYVWELYNPQQASWMPLPSDQMGLVAEAQRYYLLGHASFLAGIFSAMSYARDGTWRFQTSRSYPEILLFAGFAAFVASFLFGQIGFLNQFAVKFQSVAGAALVMGFAISLIRGRPGLLLISAPVYGAVFISAIMSGWKHQIIAVSGLLMLYLFPRFKRSTAVAGVIALLIGVTLLPAYNNTFRKLNWDGRLSAEIAAAESIRQIAEGEVDISEQSWHFLKDRTTEIGLFTDYISHTPDLRPYYGLSLAEQAVLSIIPRAFWAGKPVTENLVMERVYENGAVETYSDASAKPQLVVDGYLSGGALGVGITCFLLGLAFSWTSRLAEKYLGGYRFGSAVVYTGLFSTIILTNSFEFFANTFFWSVVTLFMGFVALQLTGFLYWEPTPKRS